MLGDSDVTADAHAHSSLLDNPAQCNIVRCFGRSLITRRGLLQIERELLRKSEGSTGEQWERMRENQWVSSSHSISCEVNPINNEKVALSHSLSHSLSHFLSHILSHTFSLVSQSKRFNSDT